MWLLLCAAVIAFTLAILIFGNVPGQLKRLVTGQTAPLSIQGQVTYLDRDEHILFVQNESAAYRVDAARIPGALQTGQSVQVLAVVEPPSRKHEVQAISLESTGKTATIKPLLLNSDSLHSNLLEDVRKSKHLVELAGIVREAHTGPDSMTLRLRVRQTDLKVKILSQLSLQPEAAAHSYLRVRGVLDAELGTDGDSLRPTILVQQADPEHLQIERPAKLLQDFDVKTIASVAGSPDEVQRVRLRGKVIRSNSGGVSLDDGTGKVDITLGEVEIPTGKVSDAWGYLQKQGRSLKLEDAVFLDEEKIKEWERPSESVTHRLNTVEAIHKLPAAVAGLQYPVLLRGVVTFVFPDMSGLFLQDNTDGLYVRLTPGQKSLRVGQKVVVTGRTAEGGFAPILDQATITPEGEGALPQPADVDLGEALSGRQDSRWVELEGVIHRVVKPGSGLPFATAEFAGNAFQMYLPTAEDLPSSLVDAKVRVRGVCGTDFSSRRQMRGIRLFVPGLNYIKVVSAPTPEEQLAIRRIADLDHFSMDVEPGRRVRIRAVVTKAGRNGRVFLHDSSGALRADVLQSSGLHLGDLVNAVGFVHHDASGVILSDGSQTLLRRGVPEEPQPISAEDLLEQGFEAQLVELRATLLDHFHTQGRDSLIFNVGRMHFRAVLEEGQVAEFARGSFLRVRGVAELQPDLYANKPLSTIFLRSQQDVTLLRAAPRWNSESLGWALLAIGALTSLAIAWALILRRQVRQQTRVIRNQLSEAEHLREGAEAASRAKGEFLANMSHEIRTPLNGVLGMTEIALMEPLQSNVREYLEVARESGLGLLQVINDVLDVSKIEAGRMTIEIAPLNLYELLEQAMLQFKAAAEQKAVGLHLVYPVHAPRYFQGDAMRIRQIALNLLSNATKFTKEGEIRVRVQSRILDELRRTVRIEVQDTGIGIPIASQAELFRSFQQADTSTTRKYGGTGLGLSISKKLVELMGGAIVCASEPGEGSVFSVEMPLLLGESPALHRPDIKGPGMASTPVDNSANDLLPLHRAIDPATQHVRL